MSTSRIQTGMNFTKMHWRLSPFVLKHVLSLILSTLRFITTLYLCAANSTTSFCAFTLFCIFIRQAVHDMMTLIVLCFDTTLYFYSANPPQHDDFDRSVFSHYFVFLFGKPSTTWRLWSFCVFTLFCIFIRQTLHNMMTLIVLCFHIILYFYSVNPPQHEDFDRSVFSHYFVFLFGKPSTTWWLWSFCVFTLFCIFIRQTLHNMMTLIVLCFHIILYFYSANPPQHNDFDRSVFSHYFVFLFGKSSTTWWLWSFCVFTLFCIFIRQTLHNMKTLTILCFHNILFFY